MKSHIFSLVIFLVSVNHSFAIIKPRVTFSSGSNGYRSTNASVRLGSSFYIQPSYRSYSSNSVSEDFKAYSARAGYDGLYWGLALEGGVTPKKNDYENSYTGADMWFEFPILGAGETSSNNQLLMEIGGGIMGTKHTDYLQALTIANGGGGGGNGGSGHQGIRSMRRGEDDEPTIRPGAAINIFQTDITGSLGFSFFSLWSIDGEYSKSVYDKDLVAISARDLQLDGFEGVNSPVRGYRKSALTSRLSLLFIPYITPFISHSSISFELDDPTATSLTVGGSVNLKPFRFDVAFETYDSGGASGKTHTTTFGGSIRF